MLYVPKVNCMYLRYRAGFASHTFLLLVRREININWSIRAFKHSTPVVNSKERTHIATPWSTWRCTLVLSTTVRKVCGLSYILIKFSTLIHVICYNNMPIPCCFVWGLRIDDLSIYVYSNLLKNWSLVHNIPYYRPEPILLADGMDEIKPQSDGTFVVNGGNNITTGN